MSSNKPLLSFWQIVNMNVGFFGIQYSFGLQQSSMSPIYKYLGAEEDKLPFLWLAGPMTGLIVQPIIGAMSDKTDTKMGRRTPYFLIGAILCSISLFIMPFSSALWMAAGLLWILDAANNITMEPYRAFVSDKLDEKQHSIGFLTQSAFTGLGQTLSYLTPSLLVWIGINQDAKNSHNIPYITIIAFIIGAFFSISSILWTLKTTKEYPLTEEEKENIAANPNSIKSTFEEIVLAIKEMPLTMKQLSIMMLFQWYAFFCYWQYIVSSISQSFFNTIDAHSPAFTEASLINGKIGAFYNFIAFIAAFAMVPFTKRIGAKMMHAIALTLAGTAMLFIPSINEKIYLFIPMIGIGICWASTMGNPYIMLAGCIPPKRTGVYMGIFNMFIVIPMMIQVFTLPLYYKTLLSANPQNVIRLAGVLLLCAAVAVSLVKVKNSDNIAINSRSSGH